MVLSFKNTEKKGEPAVRKILKVFLPNLSLPVIKLKNKKNLIFFLTILRIYSIKFSKELYLILKGVF